MKFFLIVFLMIGIAGCSESEVPGDGSENDEPNFPTNRGSNDGIVLIDDKFAGVEIILAGSRGDNFIVSFEKEINGTLLEFTPTTDDFPVIMQDVEGNKWDVFGYAVDGPRKGQRLKPTQSLMGYWFSFATFYPGIEIFGVNGRGVFENETITGTEDWLVPKNEVRSGGVGRDGIPAISSPGFDDVGLAQYMEQDDLVVGFSYQGEFKAYPHDVLDWHEIVNDELENLKYSVIYCPLTGTATVWNRVLNGEETTFGVSGLLYNTNIVPYDRLTNTNWSQLFDAAIQGDLKGAKPENFMAVETSWETWLKMYPLSRVMNYETGFNRSYGRYPYGDYKEDERLIFPVKYPDERLHAKERVHAVIVNGRARVYRFDSFRIQ